MAPYQGFYDANGREWSEAGRTGRAGELRPAGDTGGAGGEYSDPTLHAAREALQRFHQAHAGAAAQVMQSVSQMQTSGIGPPPRPSSPIRHGMMQYQDAVGYSKRNLQDIDDKITPMRQHVLRLRENSFQQSVEAPPLPPPLLPPPKDEIDPPGFMPAPVPVPKHPHLLKEFWDRIEHLRMGGPDRRDALLALQQLAKVARDSNDADVIADLLLKIAMDDHESSQLRREAHWVLGWLMNGDSNVNNEEFLTACVQGKEQKARNMIEHRAIHIRQTWTVWWTYEGSPCKEWTFQRAAPVDPEDPTFDPLNAIGLQAGASIPPINREDSDARIPLIGGGRGDDSALVQDALPADVREEQHLRSSSSHSREMARYATKDALPLYCVCGNRFMPDSRFCRRCGKRRKKLVSCRWFENCSWLVVATLCRHGPIVRLLLQAKADPRMEYSCITGLKELTWRGNAAYAACCTGNLKILKILLDHDPRLLNDITTIDGSPGGDLLWEAAYGGYHDIVQHLVLLDANVDRCMEYKVKCRDNTNIKHTAVHIAALGGSECHRKVLQILIENHFPLDVDNGIGISPLEDAILLGYPRIVNLLVENDQLFPGGSERQPVYMQNIETLFERGNTLVIAAAAEGLRSASEEQVRLLQQPNLKCFIANKWFVRFLQTPGDAPVHIMEAIFRKRTIEYLHLEDDACAKCAHDGVRQACQPLRRYMFKTANIKQSQWKEFNVAQAYGDIQDRLLDPQSIDKPPPNCWNFLDKLHGKGTEPSCCQAAWNSVIGIASRQLCEAEVFECVLPEAHRDAKVLIALSLTPNAKVYNTLGCQAFVQMQWEEVDFAHHCFIAIHGLILFLFLILSFMLNEDFSEGSIGGVAYALAGIWLISVILELREAFGYTLSGNGSVYFANIGNYVDIIVIILNGWVIMMLIDGENTDSPQFRTGMAGAIVFRWVKFISELRTLSGFGTKILPIMQAWWETKAFFLLLLLFWIGCTHMYYSMGVAQPMGTFMIIQRLLWFGDFELDEMTGSNEDNALYYGIRAALVVIGIFFTVYFMNIYIAVLSEAYATTSANARQAFTQERMKVVLADILNIRAWENMKAGPNMDIIPDLDFGGAQLRPAASQGVSSAAVQPVQSLSFKQATDAQRSRWKHIWYCKLKEGQELCCCQGNPGRPHSDLAELAPGSAGMERTGLEDVDTDEAFRHGKLLHFYTEAFRDVRADVCLLRDHQTAMMSRLNDIYQFCTSIPLYPTTPQYIEVEREPESPSVPSLSPPAKVPFPAASPDRPVRLTTHRQYEMGSSDRSPSPDVLPHAKANQAELIMTSPRAKSKPPPKAQQEPVPALQRQVSPQLPSTQERQVSSFLLETPPLPSASHTSTAAALAQAHAAANSAVATTQRMAAQVATPRIDAEALAAAEASLPSPSKKAAAPKPPSSAMRAVSMSFPKPAKSTAPPLPPPSQNGEGLLPAASKPVQPAQPPALPAASKSVQPAQDASLRSQSPSLPMASKPAQPAKAAEVTLPSASAAAPLVPPGAAAAYVQKPPAPVAVEASLPMAISKSAASTSASAPMPPTAMTQVIESSLPTASSQVSAVQPKAETGGFNKDDIQMSKFTEEAGEQSDEGEC
jgi:hypothetical protein